MVVGCVCGMVLDVFLDVLPPIYGGWLGILVFLGCFVAVMVALMCIKLSIRFMLSVLGIWQWFAVLLSVG